MLKFMNGDKKAVVYHKDVCIYHFQVSTTYVFRSILMESILVHAMPT